MGWYQYLVGKKTATPAKQAIAELTEFELSESHKILLNSEHVIEELLQYISDQQEIIKRQEEQIRLLTFKEQQFNIKALK